MYSCMIKYSDTNISNTLYKYRALDISTSGGDGVVDDRQK